jgi:hypothetical protein
MPPRPFRPPFRIPQSIQTPAASGAAGAREADDAPAPAPAEADPLALEGFVAGGDDRPGQVSRDLWDSVFPPDRPEVARLAGLFFVYGHRPDEAVRMAIDEMERETWRGDPAMEELLPLFPGGWDEARRLPAPHAAAAARGVYDTAYRRWRDVLAEEVKKGAAFTRRTWHAPVGRCLVCGKAAPGAETYQGDAIHPGCKSLMARIGPVFEKLVLEVAKEIAEDQPPPWAPPEADPSVDPDDPATWGDW